MSFISEKKGRVYGSGQFIASDQGLVKKTAMIPATEQCITDENGRYLPAGCIVPSNDANATGITLQDVDMTGVESNLGSVVVAGTVYLDKMVDEPTAESRPALEALGISFAISPSNPDRTLAPLVSAESDSEGGQGGKGGM
jgi:hypothetical protein